MAASPRRTGDTPVVMLPHLSSTVASARRRLHEDLDARGVPAGVVDDAVLVLSELLSNALKHARPLPSGKVKVTWEVGASAVLIQVTDGGGATRPYAVDVSVSSLGGRGLGIVEHLATSWGVIDGDGASTVWASITTQDWTSQLS